jgi:hypothetical protein
VYPRAFRRLLPGPEPPSGPLLRLLLIGLSSHKVPLPGCGLTLRLVKARSFSGGAASEEDLDYCLRRFPFLLRSPPPVTPTSQFSLIRPGPLLRTPLLPLSLLPLTSSSCSLRLPTILTSLHMRPRVRPAS